MRRRTYPRIDMSKASRWIVALSSYGLPLVEIGNKKLIAQQKAGEIAAETVALVLDWKNSIGIENPDELEYKYFLECIDAIHGRRMEPEDQFMPVGKRLVIGQLVDALSPRVKLYYLSRFGHMLLELWNSRQFHHYEAALLWMLLRSERFEPLIQKLLSDPRFYRSGCKDELIPSQDGISRSLVKKWLQYFGLISGEKADLYRIGTMLVYSVAFELNELYLQYKGLNEFVENLCRYLSRRFGISEAVINFPTILEWLYNHLDKSIMTGHTSGRGHLGLHSRSSVQILELRKAIPISTVERVAAREDMCAFYSGGA